MRNSIWAWSAIFGVWFMMVFHACVKDAHARELPFDAVIAVPLEAERPLVFRGGGVAVVGENGVHLTKIGFSSTRPWVADGTILLTDPITPTIVSLRPGTLTIGTEPFSKHPTSFDAGHTIPLGGYFKLCLLYPSCNEYLPIPFGTQHGTAGIGVGGIWTANTFSKGGDVRFTLVGAPWTIGVAVTASSARGGFIHGGTSGTAQPGNMMQLVSPLLVIATPGLNWPDNRRETIVALKVGFPPLNHLPEPGIGLLLGSGIAGLMLLGRRRWKA